MKFQFNPFTGNFDVGVDDPLTLGGLTVTGIAALQHIHGNIAGTVYVHVKNTSGVELQKGTPVRAVGAVGDTATLEVAAADSSNPLTMPAVAILNETLPANGTGHAAIGGELTGLATDSYSIGQALYVAAGGGLTSTRPTSGTIQQVAIVGRAHASTGSATVTIGALLNPNWDTAYSERLRWDGGASGLDAVTGRASLGLGSLATQSGTFSGTSSGTNTGDVTLAASVADVLSMSGQELQADDPGDDRILFWDDSAGKLTHLTLGTNLTITGTTINAGGLTKFTEAESTSSPNATVYVDSLTAAATSTNADVAIVAKGTGATLAQVPDGTTAGGNKRGTRATDWQRARSSPSQVASANASVIGGGTENTASGAASVVSGGQLCTASANWSAIAGGNSNTASSTYSFVGGGQSNTAQTNTHATVCGGNNNGAFGQYAFVGGGASNAADQQYSVVGGGQSNAASALWGFVGGGFNNNVSGDYSTVVGGFQNSAAGDYSFISGGRRGTTRSVAGYHVFPACNVPIADAIGVTQSALLLLARQTTNATATVLTSNTSAAGTTNQVILPNNSAYYFRGSVIANVTAGGDTKAWTFEGAIKRGATAATTAIVDTVVLNVIAQDAGAAAWTVAVTADTTNGGIAVTVTGAASTTIRWVAKLETTEVTY